MYRLHGGILAYGGGDARDTAESVITALSPAAWYDPSVLTSLFTDTGGTTLAAVNQKVARINDRSGANHVTQGTSGAQAYLRGSPSGANLVDEPFFYDASDWTAGADWTITAPAAVAVLSSAALSFALAAVSGKTYLVKYTVQARSAGSVAMTFGGVTGLTASAAGTYWQYFTATGTDSLSLTASGFSGTVRGISVWDVSAGSVEAPYFLEFDGAATFYSCSSFLTDYPFVMASMHCAYPGATVPTTLCFYQGDADTKLLEVARSLDWKEGTISAYVSDNSFVQSSIADLAADSNVTEQNLIAGSAAAHSNTWGTKTSFFIGKGRSTSFYMKGRFYGGLVVDREIVTAERAAIRTYYYADNLIQAWGDSMTAGSGTGVTTGYPNRLRDICERFCENKGAGGETSAQIRTRFEADATNKDQWTNIFWMGTNDALYTDPSTPITNIAACVAGLAGQARYLVLGVTRAEGASNTAAMLDTLDAALLAAYGNRFVDVRAYLQSKGDGSANDLSDIADGLVPRSLRSDTIHLNDAGYQHVANLLADKLDTMGWL